MSMVVHAQFKTRHMQRVMSKKLQTGRAHKLHIVMDGRFVGAR